MRMATQIATVRNRVKDEESEEDKELQSELKLLVDKVTGKDVTLISAALEMLKYLIRTSTTSMTSVPKPLKYLTPYYNLLKMTHKKMSDGPTKKSLADVISLLAMGTGGGEEGKINCDCLKYCLQGRTTLYQLAFICARHLYPVNLNEGVEEYDEINNILSNTHLSSYFSILGREIIENIIHSQFQLDVMEPKCPEEVYKTWLEPVSPRISILGENMDSARQNLASSFVNGFVNAGFGCDKLLTTEGGSKWIYRNKEYGMLCATAALGLLHLWDVDGGLTPIDKYLYTTDDYIKSGALLAIGIVNCRVRNECDPALALLGDYVNTSNETLQVGALLGIGLAYAGTHREDVIDLLLPIITSSNSSEIIGVTSLVCGLISISKYDNDVSSTILNKIIELNNTDLLKSAYIRLSCLGMSLCYFGARDAIEVPTEAMNVLEEPFKTIIQTTLLMCAYAGSGDVLIIQELLHIVGEKIEIPKQTKKQEKEKKDSFTKIKAPKKTEWDYSMGQAMASLAVAVVACGEDIGCEMTHRIFGHISRYGDPSVRKVVPLTTALSSVSNPQLNVIDVLTKYSHDADDDVACNAIYGLGLIGAGTNNARLAASLRQLALFHNKNPSQLFMVRIAQGLVHMGKGTLTLSPLHTDRLLVDPIAMAGLLVPLVSLLEPQSLILNRSQYLLYMLAAAIQPRWLLTLDENLELLPLMVRVGQAVDTIGKAGTPKTIAGIHTHNTPVLLATAERAELATDQYEVLTPTLDGICVLKKNLESK
ncbi:hypothetical protein NQ315_016683 [Exocentrus adspersus]|uniref:26S proteasome non-ATPase regulatory subunit 2 n=1 Tax=Exocentrus adspersus TaxID=1586481 RepID=A0AAV8VPF1_9CUCU|nr:hypothetical protein NQ315_016683 [Exocentrus adspersus]